ncbi:ATP-dependent DNA helicase RecQ [Psychromonas sp. SP041]|uniref:RecQ family ATP-dependent DNA helicase n=1 Tax=Psychromonas sp. SP041 TaxID=1365007 RepID=UPI000428106D|nr:ATP-dependent DNA helicase RecQ [Psychromonas sp. SP041]
MINSFTSPKEALKKVYGYDSFREGQEEVINNIVNGLDGLFVRATGGGKSITYQIPALCKDGVAIVVSPLIALMKDQVEALTSKGVPSAYINSSLSAEQTIQNINGLVSGQFKVFYVAPERLNTDAFIEALINSNISMFAIDEAHCVSTWGQNFRPSYRKIKGVIEQVEQAKGRRIQRYACTATATSAIRSDIISELGMQNNFEIVGSFDRPNIEFIARKSYKKINDLVDICKQTVDGSIIVYCPTVKSVELITRELVQNDISAASYHGRLNSDVKNSVQDKFANDELKVIVATNAFGMGVDKDNVRYVIHTSMPGNIENYYQEAGRAGRDGKDSKAILLFNEKDRVVQEFFINCNFPPKESIRAVQVFLTSFDNGMPINFSPEEITMISPDNIKDYQVNAILKILEAQNVIKLHNFDVNETNPTIEVIDKNVQLNFDAINQRKSVVLDALNVMDRFSKTKRCLREFILDYFDETPESKHCGNCGTCHSNELARGQIEGLIPDEAVRSVLGLANELTKKVTLNDFNDLLLGVKSKFFIQRGLNSLNGYGSLSNWSKSDVESVVTELINAEYLYVSARSQDAILITPKGESLAAQSKISMVKSSEGAKSITMSNDDRDVNDENRIKTNGTVLDHVLYKEVVQMRTSLSEKHEKAPFMIYSDSTAKLIATVKPRTKEELTQLGMTNSKVKSYGQDIINLVENNEKHYDNSPSMGISQ